MLKKMIVVSLFVTSIACAKEDFKEVLAPEVGKNTEIAFIGNSLTLHVPAAAVGWHGNFGMAASSADKDYAHATANKLGVPYEKIYIRNVYPFETESVAATRITGTLNEIFSKAKYIVLQLGDNSRPIETDSYKDFVEDYQRMVNAIPKGKRFFCISTYWKNESKDRMINDVCSKHGGTFIYIGDVYSEDQKNTKESQRFTDKHVDMHPHDYGMNRIAERVAKAIKS